LAEWVRLGPQSLSGVPQRAVGCVISRTTNPHRMRDASNPRHAGNHPKFETKVRDITHPTGSHHRKSWGAQSPPIPAFPDLAMHGRICPILRPFDETMLDRVPPAIPDMRRKVGLITDMPLPEPPLPNPRSFRASWLDRSGPMGKPRENRALINRHRTEYSASPSGKVQTACMWSGSTTQASIRNGPQCVDDPTFSLLKVASGGLGGEAPQTPKPVGRRPEARQKACAARRSAQKPPLPRKTPKVKKPLTPAANPLKSNDPQTCPRAGTHPALTRSRQAWRRGSVYPEGCSRPLKTSSEAA
jgi:hypothetical protein